MKQLLFLFLTITLNSYSQDFSKVDSIIKTYPKFSKVEDLANKISTDFTSDSDKIRASFYWIATNIRYNLKEYYKPTQRRYSFYYSSEEDKKQKLQTLVDNLVIKTFISKKGVCEEYAQSLKKIYDLLEIESTVIKGYVRNNANEIGKIRHNTNHAWNAVKLNNEWIILDATWAAGYELNRKWVKEFDNYYYNIPKEKIFKTHFPEETIWVLRFGRMTKEEFYNQPIYNNTFLSSGIELKNPTNGIINIRNKANLEFEFIGLNESLYYLLSGEKYLKKAEIIKKGEKSIVSIANPKRKTTLIFFIKNRNAVQFNLVY